MFPTFCCTLYSLAGLTAEHYESKAKHNESLAKAKQTLDADVEHLRKSKSVRCWGREHSWCTGKQQEQCLCHRAYAVSTRQKMGIILSRCSLTLEVAQYHYLDLNRCWLGVVDVARIYKLTLASLMLAQTAGFQEGALWDRDNYGDRCSRAICQYNYARCANKSYKHIQMGPKKPLFWWGFDCTHEMRIIAGTDESGISVCAYVIPDLRIVDPLSYFGR